MVKKTLSLSAQKITTSLPVPLLLQGGNQLPRVSTQLSICSPVYWHSYASCILEWQSQNPLQFHFSPPIPSHLRRSSTLLTLLPVMQVLMGWKGVAPVPAEPQFGPKQTGRQTDRHMFSPPSFSYNYLGVTNNYYLNQWVYLRSIAHEYHYLACW